MFPGFSSLGMNLILSFLLTVVLSQNVVLGAILIFPR